MPRNSPANALSPCQPDSGMRFKIDENLPIEVAQALRDGGHDASTVLEEGLGGKSDTDVAALCQQETLVLITLDSDFADIRAYPPRDFSGLIVLRLRQQDNRNVMNLIPRLMQLFPTESPVGQLWIVEEERIRIRD